MHVAPVTACLLHCKIGAAESSLENIQLRLLIFTYLAGSLTASGQQKDLWGNDADSSPDQQKDSDEQSFSYIPRDGYTWDGENSWEWDYPRTMYFEPVAGLGNRLRALGQALYSCTYFLQRPADNAKKTIKSLSKRIFHGCE